jgi:uncharacterized RDD family membrane protein YckC
MDGAQLPEPRRPAPVSAVGGPDWPVFAEGTWRPATLPRRWLAALIDALVIIALAVLVLALFRLIANVGPYPDDPGLLARLAGATLAFVVIVVVALLYAPTVMARTNGRTLGKLALRLRVVRVDGEPMTFGRAALREAGIKVVLFTLIFGVITAGVLLVIDALWPLWDGERRALHDMLARTRVVRA